MKSLREKHEERSQYYGNYLCSFSCPKVASLFDPSLRINLRKHSLAFEVNVKMKGYKTSLREIASDDRYLLTW